MPFNLTEIHREKCKRDLYQEVTDKIIAALEQGVTPWTCPWDRSGFDVVPVNHTTGVAYRGINVILLWLSQMAGNYLQSRWLTCARQTRPAGKPPEGRTGDDCGVLQAHGTTDGRGMTARVRKSSKNSPFRSFTVFNVAQIDGINLDAPRQSQGFEPLAEAEQLMAASGVVIHHGGIKAFYASLYGQITLPDATGSGMPMTITPPPCMRGLPQHDGSTPVRR